MGTIQITADERAEFEAFKAKKAADERKAAQQQEREAYKAMVDETVTAMFPQLTTTADVLQQQKAKVYAAFSAALDMKAKLFEVRADQRSHSFTSADGNRRIILGNYALDAYDDTVNEGIEKVKQYISSLAKDDDSRHLVNAVMRLLARDQKGNLQPSRVMQLRKMAQDSNNADFLDGVDIIEKAYKPTLSKAFIRAEYKNEQGAWVAVPLGITEA